VERRARDRAHEVVRDHQVEPARLARDLAAEADAGQRDGAGAGGELVAGLEARQQRGRVLVAQDGAPLEVLALGDRQQRVGALAQDHGPARGALEQRGVDAGLGAHGQRADGPRRDARVLVAEVRVAQPQHGGVVEPRGELQRAAAAVGARGGEDALQRGQVLRGEARRQPVRGRRPHRALRVVEQPDQQLHRRADRVELEQQVERRLGRAGGQPLAQALDDRVAVGVAALGEQRAHADPQRPHARLAQREARPHEAGLAQRREIVRGAHGVGRVGVLELRERGEDPVGGLERAGGRLRSRRLGALRGGRCGRGLREVEGLHAARARARARLARVGQVELGRGRGRERDQGEERVDGAHGEELRGRHGRTGPGGSRGERSASGALPRRARSATGGRRRTGRAAGPPRSGSGGPPGSGRAGPAL